MKHRRSLSGVALVILLALTAHLEAQTATGLPDPSAIPYALATLVPDTTISQFTVKQYLQTDGSPGGSVAQFQYPVFDVDPAGGARVPIGSVRWQFVPFKASTSNASGPATELGVLMMGGFQLTDTGFLPGVHFSFLQTFSDAASSAIDGGGSTGKVNGDIPDWNQSPGWNFDGDRTQFDYFDIPFDSIYRDPETVSFETALVASVGAKVLLLNDIRWGFTANTGAPGTLMAMSPAEQPDGASEPFLARYRNRFRDTTYFNQGQISISDLPEPTTPLLLVMGGGLALIYFRPRGFTAYTFTLAAKSFTS